MSLKPSEEMLSDDDAILLADNIAPVKMNAQQKSRIWSSIVGKLANECPEGGYTITAKEGEWQDYNDQVQVKVLHRDEATGLQSALWRLQPGAVIKSHQHTADEECLVLEGSILVGGHPLKAGDFHFMESGSEHPDVTSEQGALLFLKHQFSAAA